LEELYRDADVMAQNSATPEGMFTGY